MTAPWLSFDPRRPARPGAFVALQVAALDFFYGPRDLEQLLELSREAHDFLGAAADLLLSLAGLAS